VKKTISVKIGGVKIGGGAPIAVQSMTDTDTADAKKTAAQILFLEKAGAEIVRISVDRPASAAAIPRIFEIVRQKSKIPIVGDFHFSGHLLLEKFPDAARLLDKFRINPGNLGKKNRDENFEKILKIAAKFQKPIRIGGNSGSIDREILAEKRDKNRGKPSTEILADALAESVLRSEKFARKFLPAEKIVLSAKMSDFAGVFFVNKKIAQKSRAPLHIGLTEAGGGLSGICKSAAAIGALFSQKIGDTIRVSITPQKNESKSREIEIAREILQSVGARRFFPEIISCPACGRAAADFLKFAENLSQKIRREKNFPPLKIAILGCVVNGPGEAENADIGIFFPGRGEQKIVVFFRGKKIGLFEKNHFFEKFQKIVADF